MPFLRNEHGQMIRKDGSVVGPTPRQKGPRRTEVPGGGEGGATRRVSHLKVDKLLGGAGPLRDQYERLVEDPNTLLKDLAAWFAGRGHRVNLAAIRLHRNRHLEQFQRVRENSRAAAAFCQTIGKQGPGGSFAEAALGHFEMKLMEHVSKLGDDKDGAKMEPRQWETYCKTLKGTVATRRMTEQMRAEYRQRLAEAAKAAEEAAKQGCSPGDVVDRVREILGLTEPGERLP